MVTDWANVNASVACSCESLELNGTLCPFLDALCLPNGTALLPSTTTRDSLFDQPILVEVRVAVLWICAVLGFLGNGLVLAWVAAHCGRRSRITLLIVHLTLSDLLVLFCATLPQIVWEYVARIWRAGEVACRLFKFMQTFAISVSNYMVVALAIDRYCAIRRPLKKPPEVWHFTGGAWSAAGLVNVANLFLYRVMEVDEQPYCRSILYDLPNKNYFKAYMTAIAVLIFFLPLAIICTSYVRIFQKIADKAAEGQVNYKSSIKPGKVHLQATPSSSLPRAKVKTLKMTVVIVLSFLVCSAPYFLCEMWRFYGNRKINAELFSVLAALAVSNSSTNPFVFLAFNSGRGWWLTLRHKCRPRKQATSPSPNDHNYSNSYRVTDIPSSNLDEYEMDSANENSKMQATTELLNSHDVAPVTSV